MKKAIGSLLFIFACIIPTSVLASEIKGDTEYSSIQQDVKLEKRAQEINDYFVKLEELKIQLEKSASKVESAVSNGMSTLNALSNYESALQQYNDYESNSIDIVGLEKLESEAPSVQPFSTKNNATVTVPTVYLDPDTNLYVGSSGWSWTTVNNDNNNSGDDAFSLFSIQQPLAVYSSHLNLFKHDGTKEHIQNPNEVLLELEKNKYHGYKQYFADTAISYNYRAHRGVSWMFFTFQNGSPKGKTINFEAAYTHTFSSTTIRSLGLSSTGLLVTFSNDSNGWTRNNFASIKF